MDAIQCRNVPTHPQARSPPIYENGKQIYNKL